MRERLSSTQLRSFHPYSYGILCSDAFLNAFEGVLYSVAGDAPRLPVPADAALFKTVVEKGRQLAELEMPGADSELSDSFAAYRDLFGQPFFLKDYAVDAMDERIDLLDDQGRVVLSLNSIPGEILEFKVSGYEVVGEWLKMHSRVYARMEFGLVQYDRLLKLLCRIEAQMRLVTELDEDVTRMLSGDVRLL